MILNWKDDESLEESHELCKHQNFKVIAEFLYQMLLSGETLSPVNKTEHFEHSGSN